MIKRIILSLSFCIFISSANATDLMDAYQDATYNDPIYKGRVAQVMSDKEIYPQARAILLPQLNATGDIRRTSYFHQKIGSLTGFTPLNPKAFGSHDNFVNLEQSIFNFTNIMKLRSASFVVKRANADLLAIKQDLIIRTAAAYFAILQAEDQLRYTQAQKRSFARSLEQAKQRYNVGLDAITSVYDAEAQYDGAVATEIANKNAVVNSRQELSKITGHVYPKVAAINRRLPLLKPKPNNVELWVLSSEKYNNILQSSRFAADAAKETIRAQFGGHLPNVKFFGLYENFNHTSGWFSKQDDQSVAAGVALNIPIFQGGLVVSQVRQAQYNYEVALANVDATFRAVTIGTKEFFNNYIALISQIIADRQSIRSAQSSVESNEAAYSVGTKTIIDVLLAQQTLYKAQQTLAADQYAYINNILALKNGAGTLSELDLAEINTWLGAIPYEEPYVKPVTPPPSALNKPIAKNPSKKTSI
jgi:outer membrane protein